jgi:hypothetical protein
MPHRENGTNEQLKAHLNGSPMTVQAGGKLLLTTCSSAGPRARLLGKPPSLLFGLGVALTHS